MAIINLIPRCLLFLLFGLCMFTVVEDQPLSATSMYYCKCKDVNKEGGGLGMTIIAL